MIKQDLNLLKNIDIMKFVTITDHLVG